MTFAQLTHRESLRDIEVCLRAQKDKLYHRGIRGNVFRSTVADANERRDRRIYADLAQALIRTARLLYADEDLGLDLDNAVYALDASTIDLRLSVFPWALFRSTKKATSQPLSTSPVAMWTSSACSRCTLRRIRYHDVQTSKTSNFLTNNFAIPAQIVLRVSENAVKSQIWIAMSVYTLVAIIKKRLDSKPFTKGYVTDIPLTKSFVLKLPDGLFHYLTKVGVAKSFIYTSEWQEIWR